MPNRSGAGLPIWNFFKRSAGGSKSAICNYCRGRLSFKTTITNLKEHLKKRHFAAYNIFLNCSKPETNTSVISENIDLSEENAGVGSNITTSSSGGGGGGGGSARSGVGGETAVRRASDSDHSDVSEPPRKVQRAMQACLPKKVKTEENKKIDISLLKMIVYDFQPFSIVNDVGFREYTRALKPNYKIPDQKTLSAHLLPKIYVKRLKEMKAFVQRNAKSVCITVDSWTSHNLDSYMGITAHFMTEDPIELKSILIQCGELEVHQTGIRIYREIKTILETWGVYDKVNFFVSDNASIIESAARYFESDGLPIFGCFARKLNLVVQDALNEIKDTSTKVQRVVSYFRKSTIAKEKLLKYQINQQNVAQPKTVIKSVPTRWNSVYLMLERFIELGEPLRAIIPNLEADLPIISKEEWKCIEQICVILKPFYEATVEMSAESYLVASKAMILTSSLINICNYYSKQELYDPVKKLAEKLKEGMKYRLGKLETNETMTLSTVLDPRFKLKAIKNQKQIEHLKNVLKIKIIKEINNKTQPKINSSEPVPSSSTEPTTTAADPVPSQTLSLWSEFDTKTDKELVHKTSDVEADEQLEKYLADNIIKRTECPLKYWREHKFIYPELFALFVKHCNIVATSLPCERIFSKSGYIINDRKTRLSATKAAQLMFLNVNKI